VDRIGDYRGRFPHVLEQMQVAFLFFLNTSTSSPFSLTRPWQSNLERITNHQWNLEISKIGSVANISKEIEKSPQSAWKTSIGSSWLASSVRTTFGLRVGCLRLKLYGSQSRSNSQHAILHSAGIHIQLMGEKNS
jgi:hypothetical protein